jgi:hypothetical protein
VAEIGGLLGEKEEKKFSETLAQETSLHAHFGSTYTKNGTIQRQLTSIIMVF